GGGKVAPGGAEAHLVVALARTDLPAVHRGPGGAAVLSVPLPERRRSGRGTSVVHGDLRPGQPHHEPPVDPVHARPVADHADAALGAPGGAAGRLPRRGARQDPPRAPPRRDDRVRGAAPFALL